MSDEPAYQFVRAEEDRHRLTVHCRADQGERSVVFSRHDEPGTYTPKRFSVSGSRRSESGELTVFFAVAGCEGAHLFGITDADGNTIEKGTYVTHYLSFEASGEDVIRLSHQLHDFMQPAEEAVKFYKPHLDGLAFGDDHLTITSSYDALTLGLATDRYRYTFVDYKIRSAPIRGFIYLRFGFLDENNKPLHVQFAAPDDDAARADQELRDFFKTRPELGQKVSTYGIGLEEATVTQTEAQE